MLRLSNNDHLQVVETFQRLKLNYLAHVILENIRDKIGKIIQLVYTILKINKITGAA
jgi:hypothetical protein